MWGIGLGGFIVVAHKDNIERLLAGTERKLGERARYLCEARPADLAVPLAGRAAADCPDAGADRAHR